MPDLADIRPSSTGRGALIGTAVTNQSGNTVKVRVGGIIGTVRVVAGETVDRGNIVLIMRNGASRWVVAVINEGVDPGEDPPPSKSDPSPTPKPSTKTGSLVVVPVHTATWRGSSWRTDIGPVNSADMYQGKYSGSSFGRQTGVAFYGSKPRTLKGATVTKATIKVRRLRAGVFAARTPTLRLVSQSTRPGGAPTLNETTSGPSLAVGKTNTSFVIPKSWAQAIINGSRGGIAVNINSNEPYMRFAGKRNWSAAWTLTIYWKKES